MNNNIQIETVEQAAKRILRKNMHKKTTVDSMRELVEWSKQQDEVKYKELLDSHNELLKALIECKEDTSTDWDADDPKSSTAKKVIRLEKLINKAKNIKL